MVVLATVVSATVLGHVVYTRALSMSCAMRLLQKAFSVDPGRPRRHVLALEVAGSVVKHGHRVPQNRQGNQKGNPVVHDAVINTTWSNYGFGAHDEVMVILRRGMALENASMVVDNHTGVLGILVVRFGLG